MHEIKEAEQLLGNWLRLENMLVVLYCFIGSIHRPEGSARHLTHICFICAKSCLKRSDFRTILGKKTRSFLVF